MYASVCRALLRPDTGQDRTTSSRRSDPPHRLPAPIRRRWVALTAVVVVAVAAFWLQSAGSDGRHLPHEAAAGAAGQPGGQLNRGSSPVASGSFSQGACISFSPTRGDRHQTVFIDAGHGGIDPGATGSTESGATIHEADLTLAVVLDAVPSLRAQGFRVVVSRTGDTSVARLSADDVSQGGLTVQGVHDDVAARDVCANLAGANVLVGVYFDAGASAENAGSVTAYDEVRPFAAANLRLATLVQTDVLSALNAHGWAIPDDGVVTDVNLGGPALSGAAASYGHLLLLGPAMAGYSSTPSQMPGALIEPLYITDPFEGSVADSTTGQQAIAAGLDEAVMQYFAPPPSPGRPGRSGGSASQPG